LEIWTVVTIQMNGLWIFAMAEKRIIRLQEAVLSGRAFAGRHCWEAFAVFNQFNKWIILRL